jgi:hypothetical protein
MGRLAEIIGASSRVWGEDATEQTAAIIADDGAAQRIAAIAAAGGHNDSRAWRLWLEAEWLRHVGAFDLAYQALDAASRAAEGMESSTLWRIEAAGLRAKLLQDEHELAQAYEPMKWAMEGWLFIGQAVARPAGKAAEFAREVLQRLHVTDVTPSDG